MQLTFTTRVDSLYNRDHNRGSIQILSKSKSLSPHDLLSTGHHMLGFSFMTSQESYLYTTVTRKSSTENNCVMSNAQNTTALQANVFLIRIHRLVVRKGKVGFRQRKPNPSSTANSTISNSTYFSYKKVTN
jgi:hypothetical protein